MAYKHGKFFPEPLESYSPKKTHPLDRYAIEQHTENLSLVWGYLAVYGVNNEAGLLVTPWMLAKGGLARVGTTKKGFMAEIAHNIPADTPVKGVAPHYVKHTVAITAEYFDGQKSSTRYYLPRAQRRSIQWLNSPISPMMLTTSDVDVHLNVNNASRVLHTYLQNPERYVIATQDALSDSLGEYPIHKRGWGHIVLGARTEMPNG